MEQFKYFIVHISVQSGIYAGGWFRMAVDLREVPAYPNNPPKVRMLTKIWHPNFDLDGAICHSHLRLPGPPSEGSWTPAVRIRGLLEGLLLMFDTNSVCFNPDDPLNTDAAEQFRSAPATFKRKAIEWTKQYAKQRDIDPSLLADTAVPKQRRHRNKKSRDALKEGGRKSKDEGNVAASSSSSSDSKKKRSSKK
jgi:ubiquitin-protein ligase